MFERVMFVLFGLVFVLVVGWGLVDLFVCEECYEFVGEVTWVVDGDTVHVDGRRVRLVGVDAPELDVPGGRGVMWWLVDWVYGEVVHVECVGVDVFGRELCDVSLDGVSVSDRLLEFGYAREWRD